MKLKEVSGSGGEEFMSVGAKQKSEESVCLSSLSLTLIKLGG